MSGRGRARGGEVGKCLSHVREEEPTGPARISEDTKSQIQRRGHGGFLTMDHEAKMESLTTVRATYVPPPGRDVRLKGLRGELMEKHLAQAISEKIRAELNPPTPETEFCSTTQRDFTVEGFVPLTPAAAQVHDYKTDQAISFWSENHQHVQGVTAVQTLKAPFRRSALFSTPIGERLEEVEPPPDY